MKTILDVNFYDVNETAAMLGLAVITTRNYFKAGRIQARKIGKAWYASSEDIKEYLNQYVTPRVKQNESEPAE